MKETKYFCDWCKLEKVIADTSIKSGWFGFSANKELCSECFQKIKNLFDSRGVKI